MILALIISQMCFALLAKGVPGWLGIILILINATCAAVAEACWGITKSRIHTLENQIDSDRKGGE